MFPYFGRKKRLASLYPRPDTDLVIEPFAGSMGYTLYYKPDNAIGYDKDERLVELWHRLEKLDPWTCDYAMPRPVKGDYTNDLFAALVSSTRDIDGDRFKITDWIVRDWARAVRYAAMQAQYCRDHVTYLQGEWWEAPDVEATWFVDPPYQKASLAHKQSYKFGADQIDYQSLAEWCMTRRGRLIVCEGPGADWLPFVPLAEHITSQNTTSVELVYIR